MIRVWRKARRALMPLIGFLIGLPLSGFAQEDEKTEGVKMTGLVDVYFSKNFAQPISRVNKFRNFDVSENQFDLALAELVFQKTATPIGFRIDADFGSANDMVQGGTQSTLNNIQQAYLTAVLPLGSGLTLDVGKFVTHMGFEVIESRDNWNYSRSFLFAWAIPYYHAGLRAAYSVLPDLTVTGYVYNGWNNIPDNNNAKTYGASLLASPTDQLTLMAGWIGGEEQVDSVGAGARHVFDVALMYRPTERIALAVNADYGIENHPAGTSTWQGIAIYARYRFSGETGMALRAEIYDDRDGFTTGTAHRLGEVTATFEHTLFTHLLLRAEFRHDWSTQAVFDDLNGVNVLQHQDTFLAAAVISF